MTGPIPLTGISSMATRLLLADLCAAQAAHGRLLPTFTSVGGVDAARRVQAGERFDIVMLADDALGQLAAAGLVGEPCGITCSAVAIAIPADANLPDVGSEAALREALLAARAIGYSTGPSGAALLALIERMGLSASLKDRLVQSPAGIPVARMLAEGQVSLGFQQLSELMNAPGIRILGGMPPGCEILTVFAAAVGKDSAQPEAAAEFIRFMRSAEAAALIGRHGMTPAVRHPQDTAAGLPAA